MYIIIFFFASDKIQENRACKYELHVHVIINFGGQNETKYSRISILLNYHDNG